MVPLDSQEVCHYIVATVVTLSLHLKGIWLGIKSSIECMVFELQFKAFSLFIHWQITACIPHTDVQTENGGRHQMSHLAPVVISPA